MDAADARRRKTEALIEAIWGPAAAGAPLLPDSEARRRQNKALAKALKAYLQQYFEEAAA